MAISNFPDGCWSIVHGPPGEFSVHSDLVVAENVISLIDAVHS